MKPLVIFIAFLSALIFVYILYCIITELYSGSKKVYLKARKCIESRNYFVKFLERKQRWLKSMGVSYMVKREISVYSFISLRVLFSIICVIISCLYFNDYFNIFNYIYICCLAVFGYFIPVIFIRLSNVFDNAAMLEDIKIMYDTLTIQSKSGVYIADILTECYLLVRVSRLKTALRELSNYIYTKHDLSQGLQDFNSKFSNIYIDMLVMTIEQSLKSGQTVQMFQDIAQQIQQVEYALYEKEKRRAENKMLAYQLAVYFAILIVVVYAMFSQLLEAFAF